MFFIGLSGNVDDSLALNYSKGLITARHFEIWYGLQENIFINIYTVRNRPCELQMVVDWIFSFEQLKI